MTKRDVCSGLRISAMVLLFGLLSCIHVFAEGPLPDAPSVSPSPATTAFVAAAPRGDIEHHFWDKANVTLFAAAAASNFADFGVTRANLQNGGQELNPMVRIFGRSTAGLAMNFVGETAGVVSISYFFHKTGHHKLERAVSFVDIGGSTGAVAYGLMHR